MGIVPLWGFQMLIALAVSIFFRLNKTLVILAANISIPPLIPFILFLSHWTGKFWFGKDALTISMDDEITFELVHTNFVQYVVGATTLAIVAGVFFGLLTFGLLSLTSKKRQTTA